MYGSIQPVFSFWWLVPLLMMIFCFLMMRGKRRSIMCGFKPDKIDYHLKKGLDSAVEILNKRYASGEIKKEEYEEMKKTLIESNEERSD